MEITSYKVQPTLITSGKEDQRSGNQKEAVPVTDENAIPKSSIQNKFLNKPPTGEGKTKTIKIKGAKARVAAQAKPNKKLEPDTQETKPQSNNTIDSYNEIQGDDLAKRQELEDMIEALDPHFNEKKKARKDLEFIFDPKQNDARYHEEGNMEHYTKENEKKREALKSEPAIIEALENIINLYEFKSDGTLNKAGYSKIHIQIAKSMRKDLKAKALERLVEQDWKYDSKDKGYMTKKELFDSIFELGDVWTPDIDVHQYVAFFQKLRKMLKGKDDNLKAKDMNEKGDPYNILQ